MWFLPLLHFFAFLIYVYLAVFALVKNPKGSLNRACAAFCFSFSLWSFTEIFIQNPNVSINTVKLVKNINAIGWCSFASFYIWFIFVLTKKEAIINSKLFRVSLFILPLLFIYANYAGFLKVYFIKQPWGWPFVWVKSIWHYIFYLYYSSFVLIGIYLTIDFSKKAKELIEKKQAKIIYVTSIISLMLGSVTDALIPELDINTIPRLGNIAVLVLSFGVVYAITKYKFLIITPSIAAEKIISTMTNALILLDTKGNIISVNNAALDLLEYEEKELESKEIDIFFAEEKDKPFLLNEIISGETIKNCELILRKKSGENSSVLFSTSAIRDEAGGIAGIVFIANDITERKKTEKSLREIEEKMIRSEKLAALGKLVGMVSHELRNPLSVIKSSTYYLRMKLERLADEKIKKYLDILDQEVSIADRIIGDFLTFSRVRESQLANLNIRDILKGSLSEINISENIEVTINLDNQIPQIKVDGIQLKRVFSNIILNALQAMPKGGRVSITGIQKDEFIEIDIKDTGEGISKENLSKIFDPLFSTKPRGTGLGLAVCQTIIEGHNGTIEIESEVGKGTEVKIKLPLTLEKK